MARGPSAESAEGAAIEGGTANAQGAVMPDQEVIAVLMKSMQCDVEMAERLLAELHTTWEGERAQESATARIEHLQLSAEKQWIEWQRAKTTRGPVTDDLNCRYSSMADDTSQALAKREAAMLFSAAEAYLNDAEDYDEGLKTASEALAMYREAGDAVGEADSLRLVIHAHRLKADTARWDYSLGEDVAQEAAREAEALAEAGLERFRGAGDARGEAAMLLSLAEVLMEDRHGGRKAACEALKTSTQALALFKEVGDRKMEARALVVQSRAHCGKHQYREAGRAAKDAVSVFFEIGDKRGQNCALHMAAASLAQGHQVEDALDCAREALSMAQEMGNKKLQAFELTIMGSLQLERERPWEAHAYGKEALEIWEDLDYGKGWASAAVAIIVEALIAKDEEARAVEAATSGLERCQRAGDRREEVFAQSTLARACLASEDFDAAKKAAEAAVDICQNLRDKSWEAMALLTIAQVHVEKKDPERARRAVQDSAGIFQEEDDMHHEAVCSILVSDMLLMSGEVGDALAAAEKGRDLFRTLEEGDQEEVALTVVSQIHGVCGETDRAIAAAEDLLELARGSGHRKGEAIGLRMLSEWYMAVGDFSKALESAKAMRRAYQELRCFRLEAYALHQIAVIHLSAKEPRLATKAAEAAQKICLREKHGKGLVVMLLLTAEAYTRLMAPPPAGVEDPRASRAAMDAASKALQAVKDATVVSDRIARASLQGAAYLGYARVLFMTGAADDAAVMAERARSYFKLVHDSWGDARSLLVQAQASYHLGGGSTRAANLATEAFEIFADLGDAEGAGVVRDFLRVLGADPRPADLAALPSGPAALPQVEAQAQSRAIVKERPKGLDTAEVLKTVREMAKVVIGADSSTGLDMPLMDMGMDSLTVVGFRNGLVQNTGIKLPSSLIFDYPTIRAVTDKIVEISRADA